MTRTGSIVTATLITLGACAAEDDPPYPAGNCMFDPAFQSTRPLADASLLGFSGADLVAMIARQGAGAITWQDGTATSVTVEATGGGSALVFAPPPRQGYCTPTLRAQDVALRVRTADGRLDAAMTTALIGLGYDGAIDFVFPFGAGIGVPQPNTLNIPPAWSSPERTTEQLAFDFHVRGDGAHGDVPPTPYCVRGEPLSSDANESCNDHDGVVRFHGAVPGPPPPEMIPPGWYFTAALGWWSWP